MLFKTKSVETVTVKLDSGMLVTIRPGEVVDLPESFKDHPQLVNAEAVPIVDGALPQPVNPFDVNNDGKVDDKDVSEVKKAVKDAKSKTKKRSG